MNYIRLFITFFRISFIGEAAYRINFFIQLFQSFLNLGMSLGGLAIIFSYTSLLGSWRPDEVLALVGVYFCVGGIIRLIIQPSMEQFIESVRTGTLDFTLTRLAFIGAMDVAARELARDISQQYNTNQFHRMLDVGGGSGAYTIAFLDRNPVLRGVFFDLPSVIPIAQKNIRQAKLEERVSFVPGDFYADELPKGCDLVLLSAIIHQNGPSQNLLLFQKIHRALESNGVLLIRDFVMDSSRTQPVAGTLFALNMLAGTNAGDTYTFDEIKGGLVEAGFREVKLILADGPRMEQLVQAQK